VKVVLIGGVLLGAVASATIAHATPIEYQINARTVGGGTETGTFFFDSATDQESNVSIMITGDGNGSAFNGTFTQAGPSTPPAVTPSGLIASDIITGTDTLGDLVYFGFAAPLTSSGGSIDVLGDAPCCGGLGLGASTRDSFGSATPVQTSAPEPTSLALLGVGLIGFAVRRRRR
jgi:PEP-CTERM motif